MSGRRRSLQRFRETCPGLPVLSHRPWQVPVTFDYTAVRDRFHVVVAWMAQKVAQKTGGVPPIGPLFTFRVGQREFQMQTHDRTDVQDPDEHMRAFLRSVRAARIPKRRIGVAFLSRSGGWQDEDGVYHRSGHRSVVLCDATKEEEEGQPFRLFVLDPNGTPHDESRAASRKMLRFYFGGHVQALEIRTLVVPKMNTSHLSSNRLFDAALGLRDNVEPAGYCVYVSLLLAMDALCTQEYVLSRNHHARLMVDLVGEKEDRRHPPELEQYHRLMAIRSFTYDLVRRMHKDGWWTGPRPTTKTVSYDPSKPSVVLPYVGVPPPPPYPPPPLP